MFEAVSMHHRRSHPQQVPHRRDPFMFQKHNQMPPARGAAGNMSRFLPTGSESSFTLSKGMTGLTKVLGNAQQVLRVVETAAPMVKEYGPMIKNLPAMYKMMKALKDIDGFTDTKEGNSNYDEKSAFQEVENKEKKSTRKVQGISTPKLYI